MPSKLAIQSNFAHRDEHDWTVIERAQFPSIKVFDEQIDNREFMQELHRRSPASLLTPRSWHTMGQEQHWWELNDRPEHKGVTDAEFWFEKHQKLGLPADVLAYCLLNEPMFWKVPDGVEKLVRYTIAALNRATELGIRLMVLNLPVGWPNNTGLDTPVDWEPFAPVLPALLANGGVLGMHEYWDLQGPEQNWGWWAGRIGQCPWDVPIVIGECGVDRGVMSGEPKDWGPDGMHSRGYVHHLDSDTYLDQLKRYDALIRQDRRIHSAQIFTYDTGSDEWKSFDFRPGMRDMLAAYVEAERNIPDPAPKAFPYYPANVVLPQPVPEPQPTDDKMIRVLMPNGSVQRMAVEEYLRGVVPHEVPASWPEEALKAQAVAARTYAYYCIAHPKFAAQGADVDTTTKSQVWLPAYHGNTDRAIRLTRGEVIYHNGKLINAFFHARSGGKTRSYKEVWGGGKTDVPYLQSVDAHDAPNGEARNGHGVGMSQWGAHYLAKQGKTYKDIIQHFYMGVEVRGEAGEEPDMTMTERLIELLEARFGDNFVDARKDIPTHEKLYPSQAEWLDFNQIIGVGVHHTAHDGTFKKTALYHLQADPARNKQEWPTIAYGVGVGWGGKVYLLRNIEVEGYHVYGMNEKLLSVAVMGDLTKRNPTPEETASVKGVLQCFADLMKRPLLTKGHNDWSVPGHGTSCPGPVLTQMLREMKQVAPSLPPKPEQPPTSPEPPVVGPGIAAKMAELGDEPATDEVYITEGWSVAIGIKGHKYEYFRAFNRVVVTKAA